MTFASLLIYRMKVGIKMKKIKLDVDIKPLDYYNARKEYLEEFDKLLLLEFSIKKAKKVLKSHMKEWDGKLMIK